MNLSNFLTYFRNYDELIDTAKGLCQDANVDLSNGGGIDATFDDVPMRFVARQISC